MDLPSLPGLLLPASSFLYLLVHHPAVPHTAYFPFMVKGMEQWPRPWKHWTYNVSHRSEAADPIQKPPVPAGRQQLGLLTCGMQCKFKISGSASLTAWMQRPRDQAVEMRVALLWFQITGRNFCFPSLDFVFSGPGGNTDVVPWSQR